MEHDKAIERGVVSEDRLCYLGPSLAVDRGRVKQFVKFIDSVPDTFAVFADGRSSRRQLDGGVRWRRVSLT